MDVVQQIQSAWDRGAYAIAEYWCHSLLDNPLTGEPQPLSTAKGYLTRVNQCREARTRCWDATYYWEQFELASDQLDLFSRWMPSTPWIADLTEEIRIRHIVQQALRQMQCKDPRIPQDFEALVHAHPDDRPYSQELEEAARDYRNLRGAETQVRQVRTFDELAEAIEASERACQSSIWT